MDFINNHQSAYNFLEAGLFIGYHSKKERPKHSKSCTLAFEKKKTTPQWPSLAY